MYLSQLDQVKEVCAASNLQVGYEPEPVESTQGKAAWHQRWQEQQERRKEEQRAHQEERARQLRAKEQEKEEAQRMKVEQKQQRQQEQKVGAWLASVRNNPGTHCVLARTPYAETHTLTCAHACVCLIYFKAVSVFLRIVHSAVRCLHGQVLAHKELRGSLYHACRTVSLNNKPACTPCRLAKDMQAEFTSLLSYLLQLVNLQQSSHAGTAS